MDEWEIRAISIDDEAESELGTADIERWHKIEELKIKRLDYLIKREALTGQEQDREERKTYANKIYEVLVNFLFTVIIIVALCAIEPFPVKLSDTVIITLLTTTSANVIGIFLVVTRYLFKTNTIDVPQKEKGK